MISTLNEWAVALSGFVELSILGKATVMLALGLAAGYMTRRARASVRHLLLTATLATVLVLPLVALAAPQITIWIPEAQTTTSVAPPSQVAAAVVSSTSVSSSVSTPVVEPQARSLLSTTSILRMIWLAGVLLLFCHLAVDLWRLNRIRRDGLPWTERREQVETLARESGVRRAVDVLLHESILAPLTYGIWRPAILFPFEAREWSEADLRRAFVHELEHVRRNDWAIQLAARATCALYWFHPLVWIAFRSLRLQAERACDDAVVGTAERTEYAEQLVSLARRLSKEQTQPALGMANRNDLSRRVSALLDGRQRRGRAGFLAAATALSIASLVVLVIAPVRAAIRAGKMPEIPAEEPQRQRQSKKEPTGHPLDKTLVRASVEGHPKLVEKLISEGANVDGAPAGSPLIGAAREGYIDVVRVLLDKGADPNRTVRGDGSPLIVATDEGHIDVVTLLLDRGANPNTGVKGDGNALIAAAARGRTEILNLLLDRGADPNAGVEGDGNALIAAAARGRTEIVKLLLDRGADSNAAVEGDGNALIAAAANGRTEVVTLLLDRGATIDQIVPGDENALIAASGNGHLEVVKLLISRGADVNARAWAVTSMYELITEVVRKKASDRSNGDNSRKGGGEVVTYRFTKEPKGPGDQLKGEWRTPLNMARRGKHLAVVEFLLASGARE